MILLGGGKCEGQDMKLKLEWARPFSLKDGSDESSYLHLRPQQTA